MKIRRLQKTGGSSLSLILPKQWTNQYKLEDKNLVKISRENTSNLLIQPYDTKKSISQSFLLIDELEENIIIRELIAHYISGVDEVVIYGKKMSAETKNKIRQLCNSLIGFEFLDSSSEKITIKNVFDPTKFPMSQNLEKMFTTTISMIQDSYKALVKQDVILAKDVINRDFEIDKLYIAVTRQLYVCIRNDLFLEELDLDDIDLYFFQAVAKQLERIADHAVKIANTVSSLDISGTPISISITVINTIISIIEQSKTMVKNLDKNIAHEILDKSDLIENQIYTKKTKKHKSSVAWDVLEDSLDRIRGYIMNMAETVIDQAILRKK